MKTSQTLALRLLTGSFFLGIFFYCLRPIEDHDIWWHLATGRWIIGNGNVPTHDMFSLTALGSSWIDNYWLFQVAIYLVYKLAADSGLLLYKSLMAVAMFIPLYKRQSLRERDPLWLLVGLAIAFFGSRLSSHGWGESPKLITYTAVSLLFLHLDYLKHDKLRVRSLWVWVLVLGFWANLHPGFLMGLALVALYSLGELFEDAANRRFWLAWPVVCFLATLLTPYGYRTYQTLLDGMRLNSFIGEWVRPPWQHMSIYWIVLISFWVLLVSQRRRTKGMVSTGTVLIAVFLSWQSSQHVLAVPFFVLFSVPWVLGWASDLTRRGFPYSKALSSYQPALWAGAVSVLIFMGLSAAGIRGGVDRSKFPVEACHYIEQAQLKGPFFQSYDFGGYWIWRFAQHRPVFMDGRYPTVKGYIPLREELAAAQHGTPQEWNQFLDKWKIQTALLDNPQFSQPSGAYTVYFPATKWNRVYCDSTAVIYTRRS